MRIYIVFILISFSLVETSRADFSNAWKAYKVGKYENFMFEIDVDELNVLSEKGDANVQYTLGVAHLKGLDGLSNDNDEAMNWFLLAAKQGNANASLMLGKQYYAKYKLDVFSRENLGPQVEVNEGNRTEAEKWWDRALDQYRADAEQGSANAMYKIGNMYSRGEGVPEDDREAATWFRRAAELGHVHAMFRLAVIYEHGISVLESYAESENWYIQSSELGYARAQRNLAYKYQHGLGVSVDNVKAYAWYLLSAVDGISSVRDEKDELAEVMTTDEIVKAQRLATTLLK